MCTSTHPCVPARIQASKQLYNPQQIESPPPTAYNVEPLGNIPPPMLAEDTELQGEYDGVDAPKDMGKGAIHPFEQQGGAARAKGAKETADGIVLLRWL
jgi:hypothetical protein